jgi:hypothetical protein
VIISGIAVQSDFADWDQGVVRVRPDLGDVEYVKSVVGSVLLGHGLHKPVPAWEVALSNLIVKVIGAPFRVFKALCCSFCSSEILDALCGFVVILDIVNFAFSIDPSEGVG